ncbi:thiamine pyrophosphate enzyme [Microbacterium barkeri]|uniref:Thiamine pyrophosphate enzyme n=1 Tax=Microbacterium barkeri TaxID=33917 RepID=A0A9W6H466_9MICO|nr:thiamine pyrophosphate-binding protein [Microbacterium barkeri]MDI6944268.1 thiamine pyrophosphate-binding protein [Microbacterium barkeri]MDR6875648.1 acetolactate synthase-1/2/3 large subunit [Microbacterium barkeri]GLJ62281.1 thiamine pyrophosphate enzyme [Microbacterium barkeri]
MKRTGGELLAEQLIAQEVKTVFGVPGIQLDYAVDGFAQHRDDIDFISARHEQGAAYMADGYARVSDRPGVAIVVPGPGLLNAGAALSTAFATNSRMVCITGQIPSPTIGRGLGMLHEITDQSGVLKSLTKWSGIARTPEEIPDLVQEAFRQVGSGRPRPVGIEIPPDVLKATTSATAVAPAEIEPTVPDAGEISRSAALLRGAEEPVIFVGGAVRDAAASRALAALAEKLGAPVVMSRNGKGALSDRHPLALSRLAGVPAMEAADVILVVGSRFITIEGKPFVQAGDRKLIALNADVADTGAPRAYDERIIADARLGLEALTAELGEFSRAARDLEPLRAVEQEKLRLIAPQIEWLQAIRRALPDDGVLVEELTQVGYAARLAYPVYEAGTYITPGYQGTLGYGFPTGLGARVGKPSSPVVSINGDGGFGWSLQELSTAAKYGIGLVTVVFNNGSFGNVERIQQDTFGRTIGVDLHNPDLRTLAKAYGVEAERVTTPAGLGAAIRNAAAANQPILLEVPMTDVPDPWKLLAERSIPGERPAKSAH